MIKEEKMMIIVITVMLLLALPVGIFAMKVRNKKTDKNAEGVETVLLDNASPTDLVSEEQGAATETENGNNTEIQTIKEDVSEDNLLGGYDEAGKNTEESATENITNNQAVQASQSAGSTTNNNTSQSTGNTGNYASQMPTTTEQSSGGNQGNGNGGNTHQHHGKHSIESSTMMKWDIMKMCGEKLMMSRFMKDIMCVIIVGWIWI
ncbi:MAG: hypothetical protein NC393_09415 [Clostridium sp.]|nr:hypothetical protein [Clostridium sp.]MCM1172330.1 hypothetical protein [Clostridium sp.]MCM1208192.1 hypothetical protein [Ruminococcus sp.]